MTNAVRHCVLNAKSLWRRPLFILVLAACGASAACQDRGGAVIQANREIGVSFSPSNIAYNEYQDGGVLDSEHGWVPGVGMKATGMFDALRMTNLLVGATYDFNHGTSSYCCLTLSSNGGVSVNIADFFRTNDLFIWAGKGFLVKPKLLLTATPEAEYREWLRENATGRFDIREDYTFWAPGFALGASCNPRSSLVLKARAGFEYTVSPVNAGSGNPNAAVPVPPSNMVLRPHDLWQFAGGGDWAISHAIHAYADAGLSRFGFGASPNQYYDGGALSHHEPSSVTNLTRIDAGLAWAF